MVILNMETKKIMYLGYECEFIREFDNSDDAQEMIDYWRSKEYKACCTHYNDKHQLYVEIKEA